MQQQDGDRCIRLEVEVGADVAAVWEAWTTPAGITTFFAPACNVALRIGGPYEMFFNLEAEPGTRGGEGAVILAIQPERMLSFTWNAPPHMPEIRRQWTHVVVRLDAVAPARTRVRLTHDGWGDGAAWDAAFTYFTRAWGEIVLPRLARRFAAVPAAAAPTRWCCGAGRAHRCASAGWGRSTSGPATLSTPAAPSAPAASPPGFGASDCGCASHLVFFRRPPGVRGFRARVRSAAPGHAAVHAWWLRQRPG